MEKGRYRYYRCRATVPTSTRPAPCDALYIPADEFEDVAWRTLAESIRHPAVMVAELQDLFATGGGDIGQEIASLKRERLDLKGQQSRLLELFQKTYIDEDLLEGQIGPLKALSDEKERALRVLEDQLRHKDDAAEVERRIVAVCREVSERLDNLEYEGKRATFAALCHKGGGHPRRHVHDGSPRSESNYHCTNIGITVKLALYRDPEAKARRMACWRQALRPPEAARQIVRPRSDAALCHRIEESEYGISGPLALLGTPWVGCVNWLVTGAAAGYLLSAGPAIALCFCALLPLGIFAASLEGITRCSDYPSSSLRKSSASSSRS